MDFTREPIIETIVTPKEGCKLVVRSTKSVGQEEYFVDSVEIVSFNQALFYRSLERPKAFLAPASDFEILEVKEARMVLKNAGIDRSIKIGGGREAGVRPPREIEKMEAPPVLQEKVSTSDDSLNQEPELNSNAPPDGRIDKKRDRRRNYRKRRGKDDKEEDLKPETSGEVAFSPTDENKLSDSLQYPLEDSPIAPREEGSSLLSPAELSLLLEPPAELISETINRYRKNDLFKNAFYLTEDEEYRPHDKVEDLLNEEEKADSISQNLQDSDENRFENAQEKVLLASESIPSIQQATDDLLPENENFADLSQASFETKNGVEAALPLFAEEEAITEVNQSHQEAPAPFIDSFQASQSEDDQEDDSKNKEDHF